jgi:hypothetical protein
MLSPLVLVLYLTSGLNRYEVSEEGLLVRRLWGTGLYPWNQVTRMAWSRTKTLLVFGTNGLIFYSSTDCFPRLAEFIHAIYRHSNCKLSPRLERAMFPDGKA